MSDTILRLFSADPDYVPDAAAATRAKEAALSLFPDCDQIDVEIYPRITLIDCGDKLTRIVCPHCGTSLSLEWWAERMDALADGGTWDGADIDAPLVAPCCRQQVTLRTLRYDRPMGFARFTVDVWNPAPWPLDDDPDALAKTLADAIDIPMNGLWAHY